MSRVLISLIVPVFNEQASVLPFLDRALPAMAEACALLGPSAAYEVVFVDDGSTDATPEVLRGWQVRVPNLKVVTLSRNFGKDAALAAGLQHARGHAVIPIDVDLQDPPEAIPAMVTKWLAGAMVVNGVRYSRREDSFGKRLTARAFYRVYNAVAERPLSPDTGDFRLLDRKVVEVLNSLPERSRFTKGLLPWLGFRQDEVRFKREARAAGTTKWRFWRLWNFALDGLTSSTTGPLRVWTYCGLGVACFAFLYGLFLVGLTLVSGNPTPGYPSMMTAMLFLNGLTLISLGILGEYVGRIAVEVRGRPLYVVHDVSEGAASRGDEQWIEPSTTAWPPTKAAIGGLPDDAPSSRRSSRAM